MAQLLKMNNISKSFGSVAALKNVSLDLNSGEVLALMGENGAGKSTLMNILSGGISNFEGNVLLDGKEVYLKTPLNAQRLGIAKIHQELQLVPYVPVYENMFMGRETAKFGFVDKAFMRKEAEKYLSQLEISIDPNTLIKDLRVGEQQMVEIAKALSLNSRLLIMDEPTSAISKAETEHLFKIINKLKSNGVGIIYITHRMEEVFVISDRLMVMRDGQYIGTVKTENSSEEEIVRMMVGRDIKNLFQKEETKPGDEVLRVENLCFNPPASSFRRKLNNISLNIRAGEVLGIAGLMGAGRSEFCECIFGVHGKYTSGKIFIEGKEVDLKNPRESIRNKIAFATEDRKDQGLVLLRSIGENISLPLLDYFSKFGFMDKIREQNSWEKEKNDLRIKAPSVKTLAGNLSGGNQQKVVLGRWLLMGPKLLILDEPTRGIDVGAKSEIYKLINDLAKQGIAILVVSSEMPELIGLSDRIVAFCEGNLTGEFSRSEVTQEKLLMAATKVEVTQNV